MRSRKSRATLLTVCWLVVAALTATHVFAQEIVPRETLDEWFYSRLVWGLAAGFVLGLIVGLAHLCRLSFQVNQSNPLHVNTRARKNFVIWAVCIFIVGAVLLFLDAWLLYPFSAMSLQFSETLSQVWLNYRMLVILIVILIAFTLAVALATRFKSDCRCRYAFLPGPQRR